MFKGHPLTSYITYSIAAAVLYCVTVWFYMRDASYASTWILYLGNALFAVAISFFLFFYYGRQNPNSSATRMFFAGHLTTLMGVIISCILILIMLLVLVPDVFNSAQNTTTDLAGGPTQLQGKSHGFVSVLFLDAILANISIGSFVSVVLPFGILRNQTGITEPGNNILPENIK